MSLSMNEFEKIVISNITYSKEDGSFVNSVGSFYLDAHGYLIFSYKGKQAKAHRIAWLLENGQWPIGHIDHIDGNRANNKISNLRDVTYLENAQNAKKRKDNKTGYKGVSFYKSARKFIAQCSVKGKNYYLGLFETAEEASLVYSDFAKKHHGEFYRAE